MKDIKYLLILSIICFISSEFPKDLKKEEKDKISNYANSLSSFISHISQEKIIKENKLEKLIQTEIIKKLRDNPGVPKENRKRVQNIMNKYSATLEDIKDEMYKYILKITEDRELEKDENTKFTRGVYDLLVNKTKTILNKKVTPQPREKVKLPEGEKQNLMTMIKELREAEKKPSKKRKDITPKIFTFVIPADPKDKAYLRTLRSIQKQDILNYRVIFIVNKEAKNLIHSLKKEMAKDRRVRKIDVRGSIYDIKAKLKVIPHCKGKYIIFLEKDSIFTSKDILKKLYNTLKSTKADLTHFVTYEGDFRDNQFYINKEKYLYSPKVIVQPELKDYLSKKFKKTFLGNKVFSKDLLQKEKDEFDEVKTNQEFLKVYSSLAKKYMVYTQGVLYDLKGAYLENKKVNTTSAPKKEVKKENVPSAPKKEVKKEEPKKEVKKENAPKKEVKKENAPKKEVKKEEPKKEVKKQEPKKVNFAELDKLITETTAALNKATKDRKFVGEYNSKMAKVITKQNMKIVTSTKDKRHVKKLSEFCMDNLYADGLSNANLKGIKDFCEAVFDVQVSLII